MKRKTSLILVIGILILFSACKDSMKVWIEPSTERVMQFSASKKTYLAEICAAHNDYESFQIVINGGANGLSNVNVTAGDLAGPGGAVIPSANITLYREFYVHATKPSFLCGVVGDLRLPGNYPDPLIPFTDPYNPAHPAVGAPFKVDKFKNQPVWVEVYIPEGIPAGIYSGKFTVTADNVKPAKIDVKATVWNFSIPEQRTISTAFGLYYSTQDKFHAAATLSETLYNYELELHKHRLDVTRITSFATNPFKFGSDGHLLAVDWSEYDSIMESRLNGSYYGDGTGMYKFNAGFFRPGSSGALETKITDDQYKEAAAEFARHLKEKGWMNRVYVYCQDEPFWNNVPYEDLAHDIKLMLEADPDWKGAFMVTNWWVKELDGLIDIWCPEVTKYEGWLTAGILNFAGREEYDAMRLRGDQLWFYVCNATIPPYAGYDIDTMVGFEPRIMMWGAWYEKATGFLYWSTTAWKEVNPWEDPLAYPEFSRNGDGFLFYPGDHNGTAAPVGSPEEVSMNGPVTSIRLKQTRDGLEDWEMFKIAAGIAGENAVKEAVSKAYTKLGTAPVLGIWNPLSPPWTRNGKVIDEVRKEVAALITE
jgi:hypothetical protein